MKHLISMAALAAALACGSAQAQQVNVKIGVMSDMSSLYADIGGPGSVAAAKLAVEDFQKSNPNVKVEIVSADHQNKADVGTGIVNKWLDTEGVDLVIDVPNSGVALATSEIARVKNKVFIGSGPASSDLTGAKCNANTVHWTYDTWMLANGTGKAIVKTGGDTWFFLTSDYAFGHALERDTMAAVEKAGGKVLGKVRHPINTNDFSSFLLQAQTSKAKIIGLANAGGDTINSIKAGAEFGIAAGGQKFAGLLVFASDVAALGLQTAQGLTLTETWYWDANDANRTWTKRWQGERPGKFPDHGAGRRLFRPYPLPEGGRGPEGERRRQGCGRQDEGIADRRSAVRQGHDPPRRPQAARRVSARGEEARRVRSTRATSITCAPPSRRTKPSVRSRKAAARSRGAELPLPSPLPACGERSTRLSAARAGRVRGTLRDASSWRSPPHPNPLPAGGEREPTEIAAPCSKSSAFPRRRCSASFCSG